MSKITIKTEAGNNQKLGDLPPGSVFRWENRLFSKVSIVEQGVETPNVYSIDENILMWLNPNSSVLPIKVAELTVSF